MKVCGDDCDISNDIIDTSSFDCDPDTPTTVIYLARLSGTSVIDSDYLISVIQDWVNDGASIMVGGVLMTVEPTSELPSPEPSSDPSPGVNTDPPTTSTSDTDNTAAIIGGCVVVILIIAITVTVIAIVAMVLKNCRHGDVSITNAPKT